MTDKVEKIEDKSEHKAEHKHENTSKAEAKQEHVAKEEVKETPKIKEEKKVIKKDEAVAISNDLHVSLKQSMDVCRFIKNKKIDIAMIELEKVTRLKMPIPLRGEIPHRKGRIMSGRYPVNTSENFIRVLKALRGNCIVNGLNLDRVRIVYASPSFAGIRAKSGGRRAKRLNLVLKAREVEERK
jgi:ribosomal protein L22